MQLARVFLDEFNESIDHMTYLLVHHAVVHLGRSPMSKLMALLFVQKLVGFLFIVYAKR